MGFYNKEHETSYIIFIGEFISLNSDPWPQIEYGNGLIGEAFLK